MAKIARNAPCPCGSGKKYKKCCLPKDEAEAQAARRNAPTPPTAPLEDAFEDQDDLAELSNRTVDLIQAGELEQAEKVCAELKHKYPDVIDWMERSGSIHEARGDHKKAIDYYQRCLTHIEENPDLFEEASKDWYHASIQKLSAAASEARSSGRPDGETKQDQ